jgi:hypothetical protein
MIVVVSGLPRSGTSMMMQMVQAGGMALLTDERREADDSNPRGYLEYERVKQLKQDQSWLGEAEGKAVKIVAPLLPHLPASYSYRVIFMERALEEVLQSQERMLERLGRAYSPGDRELLARAFGQQVERTKAWLRQQPNVKTLYVAHAEAVREPRDMAERVNVFLGGALDVERMAAAVDARLYRERKA